MPANVFNQISKKPWFTMFTLESHFFRMTLASLCRHWFSWARNLARIHMFCFIIPDTGSQLAMFVHQRALPDYHPSFQKRTYCVDIVPMSKHVKTCQNIRLLLQNSPVLLVKATGPQESYGKELPWMPSPSKGSDHLSRSNLVMPSGNS
jgi:hypothetical protein